MMTVIESSVFIDIEASGPLTVIKSKQEIHSRNQSGFL